ncbi:MAG TPA: hypothetical protein VMU02_07440 [bacterium]|nr:hypothetical protein [bacterium]
MARRLLVAVTALAVALATSASLALAGANSGHKLAIHVKAHPTSCTSGYPTFTNCNQIIYTYVGSGDVDVMPVFYDLAEYTVNELGLTWPEGAWGSGSWVRCRGDLAVGTINHSGGAGYPNDVSGTAIAWSTCQRKWCSTPGYLWLSVSTTGTVCPAPDPPTGDYGVVDCAAEPGPYYDYPERTYCAGIFGAVGDDPCNQPGAANSSWGEIKSMFGR